MPREPHPVPKRRPKTGEVRQLNRPLNIDLLPIEVRDELVKLRNEGKTWPQLQELSQKLVKWDGLPTNVLEKFPDLYIPHTNLHRWYDLRVAQVRKEVLAESETARAFAEKLGAAGVENGSEMVVNAMRDQVFQFTKDIDPKSKINFLKFLNQLGLTMTRFQRVAIQGKKVDAELAKIDAERARAAAEAGDPREIYLLATQDVLKKLRTREQLRSVIDPIREELIQELSHGAESFAKQIEASAS
jgi:hypothetical protein